MLPSLRLAIIVALIPAHVILSGCAGRHVAGAPHAQGTVLPTTFSLESPLPAESNPPGDIPDTQAFTVFTSTAGHFRIDAPEGWSRVQTRDQVTFTDKFDGESVRMLRRCDRAHTRDILVQITGAGSAVTGLRVTPITLPVGEALRYTLAVNSAPEPVTGKRMRLGAETYAIFRGKRCVLVSLWAPLGADNVDQWRRIVRSFRWQ